MLRIRFQQTILVFCLSTVVVASTASAQVARAFLSGTGTDAGDCSNAASPCRSLQYAIDQSAPGAEVVVLNSGGYGGATINKSITVNAPAGVVAFIGRTITVTIAGADTVILRGLSMNGAAFGDTYAINLTTGGTLIVENTVISGFATAGIHDSANGSTLIAYNCDLRRTGIGLSMNPGVLAYATIENSRMEGNTFGLNTTDGQSSVTIRNSVLAQNQTALYAEGPDLNVEGCVMTHNVYAIVASDAMGNTTAVGRVSGSTITDNTHGILASGTGANVYSFGNNRLGGNGNLTVFSGTISQQ
jgi:hypothetical protein